MRPFGAWIQWFFFFFNLSIQIVLDEHDGNEEIGVGSVEVSDGLFAGEASEVCHEEAHETVVGPVCNLVPGVGTAFGFGEGVAH
jgi:hypothetical protein